LARFSGSATKPIQVAIVAARCSDEGGASRLTIRIECQAQPVSTTVPL